MVTAMEVLFAVWILPAAALILIPWSVLRRERALWRSREIMRKNPSFDTVFKFMKSWTRLGISAREGSKALGRMTRMLRPWRE